LAALATTALPALIGSQAVVGPWWMRVAIGGPLGVVALALGAMLGGLTAHLLNLGAWFLVTGAGIALTIMLIVSPWIRWKMELSVLPPLARWLSLTLVAAGLVMLVLATMRPVAAWDGWFHWSIKARFLALDGFGAALYHDSRFKYANPEYPPLLACWEAVAYFLAGDIRASWISQVQQAWLWASAGVALFGLLGAKGQWALALPAAWWFSPEVVWQSMQGYADVPMVAFLALGTLVSIHGSRPMLSAHWVAAVLFAGAALTKNEGLPVVLIILVCVLSGARPTWAHLIAPGLLAVTMVPWGLFTHAHGLVTDVVAYRTPVLSGVQRLPTIAAVIGLEALSPMRWGLLLPACLAAVLVGRRLQARIAVAAIVVMIPFVIVYMTTPYDLSFHLSSSAHRVIMTPLGLFALAVALGRDS
jgi:hypothetical protein